MNTPIEFQTIQDENGNPLFVVVPYSKFMTLYTKKEGLIPHNVVSATVDGDSPIKAWRKHLGFTQAEIASRLNITQAAFAQIETSDRPRKSTLRSVADALGLTVEQLSF